MADGSFDPRGRFRRLPPGWSDALLARFRERVFALLIERRLLRPETAARLRRWRRSGFGVYVDRPVPAGDDERLLRLLRYVARPPIVEARLTYRAAEDVAIYTASRMHRGRRANFLITNPLEWLALATLHIPPPRRRRVTFWGRYSFVARGAARRAAAEPTAAPPHDPAACRSAWQELLKSVFEVDPLRCPCGGTLRVRGAMRGIPLWLALIPLGLFPPEGGLCAGLSPPRSVSRTSSGRDPPRTGPPAHGPPGRRSTADRAMSEAEAPPETDDFAQPAVSDEAYLIDPPAPDDPS